MTIQVRNLTTADEVRANARRLRDVFFCPRQIALAQVKAALEKAEADAAETPKAAPQFHPATIMAVDVPEDPVALQRWLKANQERWAEATAGMATANTRRAMEIVIATAKEHGVKALDIFGPRRAARLVAARHDAMARVYVAFPQWTLGRIGQFFCGRDHTSVLHACKKMGVWSPARDAA